MTNNVENTFSAYLGSNFQQQLMWQILVDSEFAEKCMDKLSIDYFDDANIKKLFLVVIKYYQEYGKVPNIYNDTTEIAIRKYSNKNDSIEFDILSTILNKIKLWDEMILNKKIQHNGEVIRTETINFIKQQEYRKMAELIIENVKNGSIRDAKIINDINKKYENISIIGNEEDFGSEIFEGIDNSITLEPRKPIRTGINALDGVMNGGLSKGEVGIVLAGSGVGKTTILTKIANTAYVDGENVLQIVFEDEENLIKRKHYSIFTKIKLSDIDEKKDEVNRIVKEKKEVFSKNKGRLVIKKFSQDGTTVKMVRNWIKSYEKKHGFKFTILVLDYLDCFDTEIPIADKNEAELKIMKSFMAIAEDFKIPAWTAIQGNRSGYSQEFLTVENMGGSIKRYQKAHFFMSISKPDEIKETNFANVKILKSRVGHDGQEFKESIFDNNAMTIEFNEQKYSNKYTDISNKIYYDKIKDKINDIPNNVDNSVDETRKYLNDLLENNDD